MDTSNLNKAIRRWARDTVTEIVNDMYAKGVRHRNNSPSKQALFLLIKSALKTRYDMPQRLSIVFPKHLVFVKYGVGKYRAKGSGKEVPKDIFDNVMARRLPLLMDLVAEEYADLIVRNIFIDKKTR